MAHALRALPKQPKKVSRKIIIPTPLIGQDIKGKNSTGCVIVKVKGMN
jgi:hypothetical protein